MLSAKVCSNHIWAFIQNVLTDCPLGIHKQVGKVDLGGTSQKGCSKVVKMFQNRGTRRALVLASFSEKTEMDKPTTPSNETKLSCYSSCPYKK